VSCALGISWDDTKPKPKTVVVIAMSLLIALLAAGSAPAAAHRTAAGVQTMVSLIVRRSPGSGTTADAQVRDLDGTVDRQLGIVDGFSATVPAAAVPALRRSASVLSATENARGHALSTAYDPATDLGSTHNTALVTGAQDWWKLGLTGRGVTVALVDTGVVKVDGLRTSGKVIYGPDLSFETNAPNLRNLDTYGHGTHMASIIAGRDDAAVAPFTNPANFVGIAPEAKILSVKIGDSSGATDVSQMIAAIDWVVQHRNDNNMNVRVLNLSFGTDTTTSYVLDPLAHAAEVAWRYGIVVVAAVGNSTSEDRRINSPAHDPYVIAVGAQDLKGTLTLTDDAPASFTSIGNGVRNPDVIAPGRSLVGLRVPGSDADIKYGDTGAVGTRFFRGSGTSQAAAVVSGAAALILQQRPTINPDQVKALLTQNAISLAGQPVTAQGNGALNLARVLTAATPAAQQTHQQAAGSGTLESARGSSHLTHDGVTLQGEKDIFGRRFDSGYHAHYAASGYAWDGGQWGNANASFGGSTWAGSTWADTSNWTGITWRGSSWSGSTWSASTWSDNTWTGSTWTGSTWTGSTWTGSTWTGSTWTNTLWE
jgi:serine protease AprX